MEGTQAVEVSRIYRIDGDSNLKAFVDISLSGFVIRGLRIVNGKNGMFVGMPRQQGSDGKWYNIVSPTSKEFYQELTDLVMQAYQK